MRHLHFFGRPVFHWLVFRPCLAHGFGRGGGGAWLVIGLLLILVLVFFWIGSTSKGRGDK